jgi:hypothetical protein
MPCPRGRLPPQCCVMSAVECCEVWIPPDSHQSDTARQPSVRYRPTAISKLYSFCLYLYCVCICDRTMIGFEAACFH